MYIYDFVVSQRLRFAEVNSAGASERVHSSRLTNQVHLAGIDVFNRKYYGRCNWIALIGVINRPQVTVCGAEPLIKNAVFDDNVSVAISARFYLETLLAVTKLGAVGIVYCVEEGIQVGCCHVFAVGEVR